MATNTGLITKRLLTKHFQHNIKWVPPNKIILKGIWAPNIWINEIILVSVDIQVDWIRDWPSYRRLLTGPVGIHFLSNWDQAVWTVSTAASNHSWLWSLSNILNNKIERVDFWLSGSVYAGRSSDWLDNVSSWPLTRHFQPAYHERCFLIPSDVRCPYTSEGVFGWDTIQSMAFRAITLA
jgi:hypothetical protein